MKTKSKPQNQGRALQIKKDLAKERSSGILKDLESMEKVIQKEGITSEIRAFTDFLFDPKRNQVARPPWTVGGFTGHTAVRKLVCKSQVAIGVNGIGYVAMNPTGAGPCSDRALAAVTDPTYTGTLASIGLYTGTGVNVVYWSGPTVAGNNPGVNLLARCCGSAIYVTPVSSVTNQNGAIRMLDVPGHCSTISQSLAQVASHPRTRLVRGAQLGDPSVETVLTWLPRKSLYFLGAAARSGDVTFDDFSFAAYNSGSSFYNDGYESIVLFEGTPGTVYDIEIYGGYELAGALVNGSGSAPWNPMAEAAIWRLIADMEVSGWVGRHHEVSHSLTSLLYKGFAKAKDFWEKGGKDLAKQGLLLAGDVFGSASI